MNAPFTVAMTLREIGEPGLASDDKRVFVGELNAHWTIGPKVHGGTMLALCANAARMEHAGQPAAGQTAELGQLEPVAVSANFLSAPDPGVMHLATSVRKRGRRVTVVDVELSQGDRTAVHATVTLGQSDRLPPLLSANPVLDLMTPEPPPDAAPIGPGHPMAGMIHLAECCDIRPIVSTLAPSVDGQPPVIQMWVRPHGVAPDLLFALLCGDVSAPVSFAVERTGWAPTVQLTAYLRGIPADGWLRVMCTCVEIGQDWFDEDHIVVDNTGRIIVQSRQLALVPSS